MRYDKLPLRPVICVSRLCSNRLPRFSEEAALCWKVEELNNHLAAGGADSSSGRQRKVGGKVWMVTDGVEYM